MLKSKFNSTVLIGDAHNTIEIQGLKQKCEPGVLKQWRTEMVKSRKRLIFWLSKWLEGEVCWIRDSATASVI